jgi:hypothetical protein
MTAAAWAAVGSVAAVVVYLVLGVFAFVQVRQAKKVRELQTRPYVIVDFEARRFLLYVAIKNIGSTPARDVSVTFDKRLQASNAARVDINEAAVFRRPIPMLAPGRSIFVTFDVSHRLFADDNLPLSYDVKLTYWNLEKKHKYIDPPYTMDLSHRKETAIDPQGIPELVNQVEAIRKQIEKWTDGTHGLRVHAENRTHRERRLARWWLHEEAQRERRENGLYAYLRWHVRRLRRIYGWE